MTAPSPEVTFELPAGCDTSTTWAYDSMHFPHPLPPLIQDLLRAVNAHAFGIDTAFVHGYAFQKDFAPPPPTQEVIEKGVVPIWEGEFVPRIADFCSRIRSYDYNSMSAQELAARVPDLMKEMAETFRYTMIVVFPFMGPTLAMVEYAEQVLGPDGPLLVGMLLQGYANESSAAGSGLGELTRLAAQSPALAEAIKSGRFDNLEALPGGPEFLRGLDAYLADYGWRVDDWSRVDVPTWTEDPTTPLRLIGTFLSSGSPEQGIQRATELRESAEREVRGRLAGEKLGQLLGMLEVARPHVAISEGRARWQLTIVGSTRVPLLALGRKLQAAGALAEANDIFYLTSDELARSAEAPSASTVGLVERRKLDQSFFKTLQPPPFLGAPPDMAAMPPEAVAVFRRFFGLGVEPSTEAATLSGNPASRGVVRGRARVIRELTDADRLQPGEILVCTMTAPPWTPLFAIAGGVVTDTGGVLSHSAICAREFAIPCVVGTQMATSVIPDGAMITVDGDNGIVRIEG